jgi:cell division protease FtsH
MSSRFVQIALLILFGVMAWSLYSVMTQTGVEKLAYSELLAKIEAGQVASIKINRASENAEGEFVPTTDSEGREVAGRFRANLPPEYPVLLELAREKGTRVEFVTPSGLAALLDPTLIIWILILLLPIGLIWFIFSRQMQSGGQSQAFTFGKSRARMMNPERARVTFKDVAGLDEVVDELEEVVDFLKEPGKYRRLGAEIPKGVVLLGPPGCGKTLLAKAIAGEAEVPFFFISGSDFVEMFVGVGAARVRDLFDQAKRRAPCLIFIDELDAVGRHRGSGIGGGHDEREQTLNQLLVEMDGFEPNSGVIVLAATNRPDILDPALLRPGRFDRRVVVDNPDVNGREGILKIHLKNKPISGEVDLKRLAQRTSGFTGADLRNVANEAALLTARRGLEQITMSELDEAIERVVAGPERRSRVISDREKKVIAHHELGHAIVAYRLPGSDPVHKVSVLPRGLALGYTLQFPEEDTFLHSRQQLLNRLAVLLGGRAAEQLAFNEVTTGAANDLERSTDMAREMVMRYGMSEELGPLTFGTKHENIFLGKALAESRNYSEDVAARIDAEVKRIIDECFERAKKTISNDREILTRISEVLVERETLSGEELKQMMSDFDHEREMSSGDSLSPASPQSSLELPQEGAQ